jgi:hypothetical protein
LEDCGLGKTVQELVWADNIVRKTNRAVLILTPLAVAYQTKREAEKFGIEADVSRDGRISSKITIANYESLHKFSPYDFVGVVGDELSAIKAFDGKRRKQVTRFMSKMQYRLGATATPAPNDFIELGTLSEALGELSQSDMLAMFFRASDNARHSLFKEGDFWNRAKWFFRAHSERPFWRWVCSWARAICKPSDLGAEYDDAEFTLPPMVLRQHTVPSEFCWPGELFPRIARTLKEQRIERRHSIETRCELVAKLVKHDRQAIAWCQYNEEGDVLEKMIPDCVQVAGCDTDDEKEERLTDFALNRVRVLVTKPKIGAWGLNLQGCSHMTFFPSHSFEQFYQATRRCWRFGQTRQVNVDIVATEGEAGVTANLQKKQHKADEMYAALVREMHNSEGITITDKHTHLMEVPAWAS